MNYADLAFPEGIPAKFGPEIARRVLYLDEGIDDFSLVEDAGQIVGLRLSGSVTAEQPSARLIETLMAEVQGLRSVEAKQIWTSRRPPEAAPEVRADAIIDELVSAGHARIHGPGTVSFRGIYADLVSVLDDLFTALSTDLMAAERHRFPTLLGSSVLERGGYLDSFPNLLMTVHRLRNTPGDFESFREHRRGGGTLQDLDSATVPLEYCLPPTMCYYVYDSISDTQVDDLRVFTAVGSSFRFEHRYESPFRRLWDFTIRETVWVGGREEVRAGLHRYRELVTALCDDLDLVGVCETAHDPFFLADNGAAMAAAQRMIGSKSELQLFLGDGDSVAAASFNAHGEYLATAYGISLDDGSPASTACVGIGLERVVLAFLAQHGIDPNSWPAMVGDAVRAEYDRPGRRAVRQWAEARWPTR